MKQATYRCIARGALALCILAAPWVLTSVRSGSAATLVPAARASATGPAGIGKIQHVIVLMQENRSFDNYFGTYPGADGIPAGVCLPDPGHGGCAAPFHDPSEVNFGGPHHDYAFLKDFDGGKMDGFLAEEEAAAYCGGNPNAAGCTPCNSVNLSTCSDVMGYHDAREIPNYWTYAENFGLQDRMFEPVRSWSLPAHLWAVSGWSAQCAGAPTSCQTYFDEPANGAVPANLQADWTDITWLLAQHGVSWGYYIFRGAEPDCESDSALSCAPVQQGPTTPGIWNPLAYFSDVHQNNQTGNIQSLNCFYSQLSLVTRTGCRPPASAGGCGLPNVSWIVPNGSVSEHPPSSIAAGQAFVTTTINAVMRSPCWNSTAIFLSWDDWGGFFDHVVPPGLLTETQASPLMQAGYGFRVPGLVISPYARRGYIDHQTLSHDAYLKFIEDDFLGGQRICATPAGGAPTGTNQPCTTDDGRPDSRPQVSENVVPGDLTSDFNFNQAPLPPLILPTHPAPGPASCAPGATCSAPPAGGGQRLQLTVSVAKVAHVRGRHPRLIVVIGCNVACSGRLTIVLSIVRHHHHHLTLRAIRISLGAHAARAFRVRFGDPQLAAIRTALRHHGHVTLTLKLSVRRGGQLRQYTGRAKLVL